MRKRLVRYRDGIADIAKKGLWLITAPLRLLGKAGIRILRYCIDAVQFLTFLSTTRQVMDWYNARRQLKEHAERMRWAESVVEPALHNENVNLGLRLIRRAIIMAIAMATRFILNKAEHAIS